MGNFNRDRFGGRRSFGRRDFGGRGTDRQMHKTICSSCGRECEVPFKPSEDKPVYCSNCFEKNRGGSDTRRFADRTFKRPHFEDRNSGSPQNIEQYNTLNAKLDKILTILSSASFVNPTPTPKIPIIDEPKMSENVQVPSKEPVIVVGKKKKTIKKIQ